MGINFNFKTVDKSVLDGQHIVHIYPYAKRLNDGTLVPAFSEFPTGDKFSTRPYLAFRYRVAETGDIFARKLYVYETSGDVAIGKDGNPYITKSPQDLLTDEISACYGYGFADVNEALKQLAKATPQKPIPAYVQRMPSLDEDGEQRRDENGIPRWYAKMKLASANRVLKETAKEPEIAAEAEAKRASKGKRGYAGNTEG